jgi:cell division protein FtsI (penicillin-binding protein 3)
MRRAISEKAAGMTTSMLEKVVTDGTGTEAAVPGYSVAGKTGTAQVALPDGRGYAKGTYISSFIGYLPAGDPQLLICVKLDQPQNAIYGGTVAAPVFSTLAQFAVAHLKIPPTTVEPVDTWKHQAGSSSKSASTSIEATKPDDVEQPRE